ASSAATRLIDCADRRARSTIMAHMLRPARWRAPRLEPRCGHNVSMTSASTEPAEAQALLLQLLDPANRADPYPLYAKCRERGPIQLPDENITVFSTLCDCDEVLR